MNHLILFCICFLSVEIFIKSNYISLINSIVEVSKKAISIILNKNISDHWKENIIPKYSQQMMNYSIQMLLILFLIIFIFVIANNVFSGFHAFIFSWNGIIESILLAFSYAYVIKLILKWIIFLGWHKSYKNLLSHHFIHEGIIILISTQKFVKEKL